MSSYRDFFAEQIRVQRKNIWIAVGWAVALLGVGTALTTIFVVGAGSAASKVPDLLKLGPLILSTALTAFPCKMLLSSRSRLASYGYLYRNLPSEAADPRLVEVAIEAMKQTLKGD